MTDIQRAMQGVRVGIPRQYSVEELNSETRNVWQNGIDWLQQCGAEV